MDKFRKKVVGEDPYRSIGWVFIVGQNPGRQRKGSETGVVWEGNRSGDFITKSIGDAGRVLLTNIVNYTSITPKRVREGLEELREDIEAFKPTKIICLGNFSYNHVIKLDLSIPVIRFRHPSFVLRFNKNKEEYAKQLRNAIKY